MDIIKILATLWYYLFPTLLAGSIIIILVNNLFKIKKVVRIFSVIFFIIMLILYVYYVISLLVNDNNEIRSFFNDFIAINISFYYWAYYLAFIVFIVSFSGAFFIKKFIKNDNIY